MEFCGVIPRDLATGRLWPQISALVGRSIPYGRGEYEIEDIRKGVANEELFALGVAREAELEFVAVCAVVCYPRKRVLYVIHGAGHGGVRGADALRAAAKTLQCDWIETRCRASVARLYQRIGFDTSYQVCILEIEQ